MAEEPVELGTGLKDRNHFQRVLRECVRDVGIDLGGHVLVVGGNMHDVKVLHNAGFRRVTLTNIDELSNQTPPTLAGLELTTTFADVEDMALPDASFDVVFTHAVLHHCRSPHRALLEMLRVSRRHVIFLEPNESLFMRTLVRLRLSFPFELPAVIANGFVAGGVRNTCVPNYIYRWSPRDLYQAVASYMPERHFSVYTKQYWDFSIDEQELSRRSETRIGSITRIIGPRRFLAVLQAFQTCVNPLPWFGRQGNKFFGCITKQDELKPWLTRDNEKVSFDRTYARR
jgi:SAM-dependent methyltransferase